MGALSAPVTLRGAFGSDRFLLGATLLLGLLTCAPLLVTPYVPLHDLPRHVGAAALLEDILLGEPFAAEHYGLALFPGPPLVLHVILGVGGVLVGAAGAAKLVVALAALLLPIGMMRMAVALDRDPRLGLLGFALAWDANMLMGAVSYEIGLGFAFLALAGLARAEYTQDAYRILPWTLLAAFTSVQAFFILCLLGLPLVGRPAPRSRRPRIWLAAVVPGVLALLPWATGHLVALDASSALDAPLEHGLMVKLESLVRYSTGMFSVGVGRWSGQLVFMVLVTAPVILGLLCIRRAWIALACSFTALGLGLWLHLSAEVLPVGRMLVAAVVGALATAAFARGDRHRTAIVGAFLLTLVTYFALPYGMIWPFEQEGIYPRQAVVLLALAVLVPPAVRPPLPEDLPEDEVVWIARDGARGVRVLALFPGLFAALTFGAEMTNRFADFGTRAKELSAIVEAVHEDPVILPLSFDASDDAVPFQPYAAFHAYVVAEKGGYDPYLIWGHASALEDISPLPHPPEEDPSEFSFEAHGRFYEYVLVQGPDRVRDLEPPPGRSVEWVAAGGRWTLYQLRTTATSTPAASASAEVLP